MFFIKFYCHLVVLEGDFKHFAIKTVFRSYQRQCRVAATSVGPLGRLIKAGRVDDKGNGLTTITIPGN